MIKPASLSISLVVAMAQNNVIGKDGAMPWHLPADLRYFKQLTLGKPILMGRRTFEAIGRPLPGRRNIVLTRNSDFKVEGCEVFHSFETAIEAAATNQMEIMVIGGAGIYAQALPQAERIYLTRIQARYEGDAFFPPIDESEWIQIERKDYPADERNSYGYSFVVLERECSAMIRLSKR